MNLSDFKFREAIPSDIPRLKQIRDDVKENALVHLKIEFEDYQRGLFEDGKGWVSEYEGEVVGFCCGRITQGDVWALFIDRKYEGCGVGNRLMELLENWMFSQGCLEIKLSTDPKTRAERLYRKRNWKEIQVLPSKEIEFRLTRSDLKGS
jgi:GNAT superfamily N-acetyltransferase